MPTAIVNLLLAGGAFACLVYHAVVCWRVARGLARPTVAAALDQPQTPGPPASVALVVPAHNESARITPLLESLLAQTHTPLRVILALDRCTDDTARIARAIVGTDPRFTLVEIDTCPADWAGKVHAITKAVEHATTESTPDYFLFTDADTRFDPRLTQAAVAHARQHDLDLLSINSQLDTHAWWERALQPVAGFELMRQYPPERANATEDAPAARAFANGQFILVRAAPYLHHGGHALVKDELLEDIAIAKKFRNRNLRTGMLFSGNMLRCRMYDSRQAFNTGWKRIYTEAANLRASRMRTAAIRLALTGTALPLVAAAALAAGLLTPHAPLATLAAAALAAYLAAWAQVYRGAAVPVAWALSAPFSAAVVASILRRAASEHARGVEVKWGGRTYTRPRR